MSPVVKARILKRKSARPGLARWFPVERVCTVGGLTQRAAADYLGGVPERAIGKTRQRLHLRLVTDDKVRKKMGESEGDDVDCLGPSLCSAQIARAEQTLRKDKDLRNRIARLETPWRV